MRIWVVNIVGEYEAWEPSYHGYRKKQDAYKAACDEISEIMTAEADPVHGAKMSQKEEALSNKIYDDIQKGRLASAVEGYNDYAESQAMEKVEVFEIRVE